jgi:glycerol-3-phosphate acyltransferase PlsY
MAYFIGSIPTAVWVGKWFYGTDVREHGSGNAGTTNTIRVLGPKAGIPVFIIDVMKGFAAVKMAYLCRSSFGEHNQMFAMFRVILSFMVILGHVFPVFAGFRGGKGIATSLGAVLALFAYPAIVSFVVFMIILLSTNYVSLGSVVVAAIFPFVCIIIFGNTEYAYVIFSIAVSVFVIVTHRKNINRLISGDETKFYFKKKEYLK